MQKSCNVFIALWDSGRVILDKQNKKCQTQTSSLGFDKSAFQELDKKPFQSNHYAFLKTYSRMF